MARPLTELAEFICDEAPSDARPRHALDFDIHEGHFVRHIRHMRQLYHERQVTLVELARQKLAGALELQPAVTGMHLIGWLPCGQDDRQMARAAASVSMDVSPLSLYALEGSERAGILLGYTAVGTQEMCAGLERLASVLVTPG